jgi:EAL domain-containing protein (putative c-di-GMP-specific phosphodiesterase class I)
MNEDLLREIRDNTQDISGTGVVEKLDEVINEIVQLQNLVLELLESEKTVNGDAVAEVMNAIHEEYSND